MSSATSPGPPSVASPRSSVSTDRASTPSNATAAAAPANARRNRSALRDYYNLAINVAPPTAAAVAAPPAPATPHSPLEAFDSPSFDFETYLADLLAGEDLAGILRVETSLVARIRGLDGEKKALVYDNYSKLIAATETIRKMRGNMDPLAPMTKTLEPAVAEILRQADGLSHKRLEDTRGGGAEQQTKVGGVVQRRGGNRAEIARQKELVKSVLAAPKKIAELVKAGRKEEAEKQWTKYSKILDTWGDDVKGVKEVRKAGEAALAGG